MAGLIVRRTNLKVLATDLSNDDVDIVQIQSCSNQKDARRRSCEYLFNSVCPCTYSCYAKDSQMTARCSQAKMMNQIDSVFSHIFTSAIVYKAPAPCFFFIKLFATTSEVNSILGNWGTQRKTYSLSFNRHRCPVDSGSCGPSDSV